MPERETDAELLRAAFRDVHGARLHGFALALLLGNRADASRLAAETLAHLAAEAPRLRHPERAAAALRAELLRRARRGAARGTSSAEGGSAALSRIGIDEATGRALAGLDVAQRAALIATDIERFGDADVAVILGLSVPAARRAAGRARSRYLARYVRPDGDRARPGSIAERLELVASRAMGAST
ncbi:MAG TPA: sigma factor-like helix-turn-helix DNA-binding protein [Candidatus Limnocylindria bacterium]|nr:sigma factor-like helix-turn-helix DNA-binding protein [Candidatus Limnocylindria bacterium]